MYYRVHTKRLYYEIELNGKYTILKGDSGGGKSVFYSLIFDQNSGDKSVHIEMLDSYGIWKTSNIPFFAVPANDSNLVLHQNMEGCILVIDENALVFKQKDAGTIFQASKNQFLLITRKNLDYLPVSVENIFHLNNNGRKHLFEQSYKVNYQKRFGRQDIILTEDSNSGYKAFTEFFADITVTSARSKSKITNALIGLDKSFKNILVVYDAAAFGMQIEKLNEVIKRENRNISVLDWYSFEHHVLAQPPFSQWIDPKSMDYLTESLEQFATKRLSQLIKYSEQKNSIRPCLTKNSTCKNCNRVATCDYRHEKFDLGIKITEFIPNGIENMNAFK